MIQSGSRLGAYEILSPLGSGGMGEVYRARDTKLGRDVALKILPAEFALDAERVARFKREAQVLASLNHQNIASIYGFEDAEGLHALVLELVDGSTLADRIAQGPLPIGEAVPIARQIADALEGAHEQGIIHRDLKPANIKVRPDGTVKVLDFGLAKLAEAGNAAAGGAGLALSQSPTITTPAMMTGVGMILGTAAYMSPEQAKGRPADKRSDIWAFGCVLFEMLTGKRAFDGEDVSETLASVLKSEPDWTAWPGEVSVPIRVFVENCLAKDRRHRIADISTARFVFAEASRLASPAPSATTSGQPLRRNRLSLVVFAAAILLTAVVAASAARFLRPSTTPPPVARFWFRLSEDERQLANAGRQIVAISPDGTRTVHTANQRLWLRSLSDFEAHPITSPGGIGLHSPVFSPDGQSVAFYAGSTMWRVSVGGAAPVALCPVDAPFGATWDRTGIIIGQGPKGVVRCSPGGGVAEEIIAVRSDEQAHGPQLLPDGRHLLFTIAKTNGVGATGPTARWDQAEIVVQDMKTGTRKTVVAGGSDGRYLASGHLMYAVGGVMLAAPFDLGRLEVTSPAVPVLEGVARARGSTTGAAHVGVSDSGTVFYVPGPAAPTSNLRQVTIADRAGVVTPVNMTAGAYVNVRASRDGRRLALGTDDGREAIIWIYDRDGTSAVRRLTLEGRNRFAIWSPDGERVAFQSDREGDLGIFAERIDGTGKVERLTKAGSGEAHVPGAWSPDGRSLVYSVGKAGAQELWSLSLPDKKSTYQNVKGLELLEPTFSPDGRWIAFSLAPPGSAGTLSANRGVYVQPFPATGARYQAPKQQLDFQPVWSSDGRDLLYVPSAASGRIVVVHVTTTPSFSFGPPQLIPARVTAERLSNDPRAFDVLPDGRFVGLTGAGDIVAQVELRMVLNWFEELKQRVPVK